MIMGVQGTTLSNYEKRFIVENNIGGVILFGQKFAGAKTDLRTHSANSKLECPAGRRSFRYLLE